MKTLCAKERTYIFMFNAESKVGDELVSPELQGAIAYSTLCAPAPVLSLRV